MIKYSILLVLLISLFGCSEIGDRKIFTYEPLIFDGNDFVVSTTLKTKQHFDKVQRVLAYYNITYIRLSSTEIQLPQGVSVENIMNFGEKAKDNEWLNMIP